MDIISDKEFVEKIAESMGLKHTDLELISDVFFKTLFDLLQEGKSIQYKDYPFIRAKKSISKLSNNSPRTKRNDRINVLIKLDCNHK